MDALSSALAAWIAFHASLGVDLDALLLPGAAEVEIVAVEDAIGHRLPDDLRALYGRANGQLDPWASPPPDPSGGDGERVASMFGHFRFLPLDEALAAYRDQVAMHGDHPPDADFEPWSYRPEDPIDPVDWQPTWFTFAAAGAGNGYAVDLAPPRGGTVGQIVQVGPDFERVLIAESLTALLDGAARGLDPEQPGRFEFHDGERDGSYPPSVEFDMNWRWTPPVPPTAEEIARAEAESAAWNAAYEADRAGFRSWLIDAGSSEAETEAVLRTVQSAGRVSPDALGPSRFDDPRPDRDPVAELLDSLDIALYARLLDDDDDPWDGGAPLDEAFAALARWRLETGAWSVAQHDEAMRILAEPRELPPGTVLRDAGGARFGAMYRNPDGSVTIEDSRLDEPLRFD